MNSLFQPVASAAETRLRQSLGKGEIPGFGDRPVDRVLLRTALARSGHPDEAARAHFTAICSYLGSGHPSPHADLLLEEGLGFLETYHLDEELAEAAVLTSGRIEMFRRLVDIEDGHLLTLLNPCATPFWASLAHSPLAAPERREILDVLISLDPMFFRSLGVPALAGAISLDAPDLLDLLLDRISPGPLMLGQVFFQLGDLSAVGMACGKLVEEMLLCADPGKRSWADLMKGPVSAMSAPAALKTLLLLTRVGKPLSALLPLPTILTRNYPGLADRLGSGHARITFRDRLPDFRDIAAATPPELDALTAE